MVVISQLWIVEYVSKFYGSYIVLSQLWIVEYVPQFDGSYIVISLHSYE